MTVNRRDITDSEAIEIADSEWQNGGLPALTEARVIAVSRRDLPVRAAAVAAAGGAVAGVASVAIARAALRQVREGRKPRRSKRRDGVLASKSFLIDIHLLRDR